MTYEDAMHEIQSIVRDLEKGDVKVNQLTQKVQRAKELLQLCKEKLRNVEKDISELTIE